jgi:hypothetical protein
MSRRKVIVILSEAEGSASCAARTRQGSVKGATMKNTGLEQMFHAL